jgi:hypothetical protein
MNNNKNPRNDPYGSSPASTVCSRSLRYGRCYTINLLTATMIPQQRNVFEQRLVEAEDQRHAEEQRRQEEIMAEERAAEQIIEE